MNKYFLLLLLIILTSCWKEQSLNSWSYQDKETQIECREPENPYSEWWHYEWYNRAQEKWQSCSWNSDSFIEWCEEYFNQQEDYENCKK